VRYKLRSYSYYELIFVDVVNAVDSDVHADEYRRLPVHGAGVQLLPQILCSRGGR